MPWKGNHLWPPPGTRMRAVWVLAAPLLANALYASFACAQGTLHHVDPLVFSALQMALVFPVALVLLARARHPQAFPFMRQGMLGGCLLGVGFLCVALSLRSIGIVPTAMLTAFDGVLANLIAWVILRQPLTRYSALVTLWAALGACFLWLVAPGSWQSDLVALACGLAFTLYGFSTERSGIIQRPLRHWWRPFFGGLFSAAAVVTLGLALCFGYWPSLQTLTWSDGAILVYASFATVVVPVVILTVLLRHVSAITLAFLALLEPLISLLFAYALGALVLTVFGWIGVGCIFLSLLLQTHAAGLASSGAASALTAQREEEDREGVREHTWSC